MFLTSRAHHGRQLCAPTYEWVIDEAVARGYMEADGYLENPFVRAAWLGIDSWTGPAQGQIDPQKEVTAAQMRVNMGISTLELEARTLLGLEWEDIHPRRVREHEMRVEGDLDQDGTAEPPAAPPSGDTPADDQPDQPDRG